ncbi:restriction endonuclease subunit S [Ligilactobacillus salivarius]|uniref:restriction endonuclease subunit S n=1 Tax=Ligilactobacillus salivarius TaxID=1624 RepID=UPI0021053918|nr:restriction endonuclease subunit S [Ligilactobacillus salivarius]UTX36320.1 restriction endonuclease subunit S [Ligilactobacillus salivarius]
MKKVRLGQMIEVQRGYDLPKNKTIPGPYPVVTSTSISAYHREYKAEDTIVIGRSGTVGNPRVVRGKFWPLNTTLFATDLKENDMDYMCYLLSNLHLEKLVTGSTVPTLNRNDIYLLEVPVETDVSKQKKIGALLKTIDSKVYNNEAIAQQLESMAKTIYNYWFLQFEFPNEEGKPYRSSGGKMVWNEELQREIPAGWEVGNISSLIDSKKNGDWGKENMQGNYVLPVSCIRGADLDFVNGKSLSTPPTRFILEKNSSKLLKPYDFVIEISGGSPTQSTGRIAGISSYLFSRFNNEIVCSNFCKAITLKDKVNYYYFLQTWMKLFENDVMFNWEGKTSGIKNLMFDSFVKNTKVVIPNKEQLNMFFELSDSIENKIQNMLKQNQELLSLRDFLLPLLMNGQVTVGE